ncbi:hypothetical protein KsCSTR_05820 [Candidatus Kuenenia stuttgartiensis]|uniref:Uncharacterized protein n=1 Tax=Kuenenia stuttgartiensis TaxID=174633 RepID=Q1PZZ5_KUEST|nr:hypothetical protein KsCSTR_05820 [Candidatus Kuenenia stuttgartiensis]CAJ72659.1 unknown protein [Candidatus Kuenenia stuttgartiensis]
MSRIFYCLPYLPVPIFTSRCLWQSAQVCRNRPTCHNTSSNVTDSPLSLNIPSIFSDAASIAKLIS